MKRVLLGWALMGMLGPAALAGVVVEMEVKGAASGGTVETQTLYAQGEMARMDPRGGGGEEMTVIFRDDTLWFVNHDKKVCQKIDEEGMDQLSAQLGMVMKQFENLPPEQRAMMEKMMQGKMPGMGGGAEQRIEKGASEKVGKYACSVSTMYSGDRKLWEVCAADESVAGDLKEAMGAFQAMSRFTEKLQAAVKQGPLADMMRTPYNKMDELSGFPVRVRTFDGNGQVDHESTIKSVTQKQIDDATFAVPAGYEVKDLKSELNRNR